jgi:hypothetical protein
MSTMAWWTIILTVVPALICATILIFKWMDDRP